MSQVERLSVNCKECGQMIDVEYWRELYSSDSESLPDAMGQGEVFDYTCPNCGAIRHIDYPMVYNDVKHKVTIHYLSKKNQIEAEEIRKWAEMPVIEGVTIDGFSPDTERIVFSQEDLMEKVRIFNSDLDDRLVELIKDDLRFYLLFKKPEFSFEKILFRTYWGSLIFEVYGDYELGFLCEGTEYERYKDLFGKDLKAYENICDIDNNWAENFSTEHGALPVNFIPVDLPWLNTPDNVREEIRKNSEESKKNEDTSMDNKNSYDLDDDFDLPFDDDSDLSLNNEKENEESDVPLADEIREIHSYEDAAYEIARLRSYESFLKSILGSFPSIEELIVDTMARITVDKENISYKEAKKNVKEIRKDHPLEPAYEDHIFKKLIELSPEELEEIKNIFEEKERERRRNTRICVDLPELGRSWMSLEQYDRYLERQGEIEKESE